MRILLLGCTGFIGKELIPTLLNAGHELCIVSRNNIDRLPINITLNKISFIKLNLKNLEAWEDNYLIQKLKKSDAIINLIGEPIADKRWSKNQKLEIKNSRINTTSFLMHNLKKQKITPRVIINSSAIGFYGTSLNDEFNEDSPNGKDFLANLCKSWEYEANQKPSFTRLVIFRIGIVLGAEGGALKKMLPIFKLGLGGPIGKGNQWMSWIHRTDLCNLIATALNNKKYSGTYNAVSPEPVTMKLFSESLAACLKRPNLVPVPGIPLKIFLGEGAKLVLEGQKVISKRLNSNLFKFQYPLLRDALAAETKK